MSELSLWGLLLGHHCHVNGENIWGWFLYPIVMLYCFYLLARICDGHLTTALEFVVEKLQLSEDVAGATFLAMASSAPELFCSIVATFVLVSASGVGNIIGSAVFNLLVIIGVTPVFAGTVLDIWWYPTARDALFYGMAILEVAIFMWDGLVYWYEGLLMVLSYVLYVAVISQNQRIIKALGIQPPEKQAGTKKEGAPTSLTAVVPFPSVSPDGSVESAENAVNQPTEEKTANPEQPKSEEDEEDEGCGMCKYEPIMMLIDATMPTTIEWVYTLFALCCVWIAFLTYFAVDAADRIGCISGMPDVVMGLVFLAAGTSVPDAMGSIAVAKSGMGDMAVANAVGSNTFDILLGLGLPWFLKAAFDGEPIKVPTDSLHEAVIILALCLVGYLLLLKLNGMKLNKSFGILLLVVYLLVITWILLRHYVNF
eukprot:TRINITY_DN103833_c0_g1_i1.p1 TRINITY_DN103833_c0_g1~~TRINITY_DN103833_c0_g1_i1.p1  ORF type:complete len:426 (-),score=50.64 TRINITY_DN103833_c0_g1_i1:183-1460(-)